jgi:hypothetical protein
MDNFKISLDDLGKGKGFMASVLRLQFSMKDDTILSVVLKLAVKSGTTSEETIENTTLDGSSNTTVQPVVIIISVVRRARKGASTSTQKHSWVLAPSTHGC